MSTEDHRESNPISSGLILNKTLCGQDFKTGIKELI
jgi:hypothetical protein